MIFFKLKYRSCWNGMIYVFKKKEPQKYVKIRKEKKFDEKWINDKIDSIDKGQFNNRLFMKLSFVHLRLYRN